MGQFCFLTPFPTPSGAQGDSWRLGTVWYQGLSSGLSTVALPTRCALAWPSASSLRLCSCSSLLLVLNWQFSGCPWLCVDIALGCSGGRVGLGSDRPSFAHLTILGFSQCFLFLLVGGLCPVVLPAVALASAWMGGGWALGPGMQCPVSGQDAVGGHPQGHLLPSALRLPRLGAVRALASWVLPSHHCAPEHGLCMAIQVHTAALASCCPPSCLLSLWAGLHFRGAAGLTWPGLLPWEWTPVGGCPHSLGGWSSKSC